MPGYHAVFVTCKSPLPRCLHSSASAGSRSCRSRPEILGGWSLKRRWSKVCTCIDCLDSNMIVKIHSLFSRRNLKTNLFHSRHLPSTDLQALLRPLATCLGCGAARRLLSAGQAVLKPSAPIKRRFFVMANLFLSTPMNNPDIAKHFQNTPSKKSYPS